MVVLSVAIGLIVGSFLNVVILRGAVSQSLTGRSRCDECGHILSVRELIPIISFLVQKARCRECGTVLSWQYPIVEFVTAVGFAVTGGVIVPSLAAIDSASLILLGEVFLVIAAVIVIVTADIRFQIIPNGAAFALFFAGLVASGMRGALLRDSEAALAVAGFFALLWLISRGRWMGLGDAKLVLGTSLLIGFPASAAAFLFSFWLGGVAAIPMLLFGKKAMQSRIPFGPFIIAGAVLAYWYSGYFFSAAGLSHIVWQ